MTCHGRLIPTPVTHLSCFAQVFVVRLRRLEPRVEVAVRVGGVGGVFKARDAYTVYMHISAQMA